MADNTFPKSGNVGIGTISPEKPLHIKASGSSGGSNARLIIENGLGHKWFLNTFSSRNQFSIGRVGVADDLAIDGNGKVGIGTDQPSEKLEVHGNILATGDVQLSGADCAEEFHIDESTLLEPGTVMVIGNEETLFQCTEACDSKVIGVLSGAGDLKPGIVLGKQLTIHRKMPLALSGKVYCKVDADYAPISVGDLLTTSTTPGHAMKATDPLKVFGAVIGKALMPMSSGTGLIPIIVSLQ